jgi:hypothetical protein
VIARQVSVWNTNSTALARIATHRIATKRLAERMFSSIPPSGSITTSTITNSVRKSKKRSIAIEPSSAPGGVLRGDDSRGTARANSPTCGNT